MNIRSTDRTGQRKSRNRCLWFAWSVIMAICGTSRFTAPASTSTEKKPVFVTASFLNRNDFFIENLQQNEIEIFENDQPRTIEFMARDELPSVYGIILERAMLPDIFEREMSGLQSRSNATSARDIAYELIDKFLARQTLWVGAYDRELEVVFDAAPDGFGAKNAIGQLRGGRARTPSFLFPALFSAVGKMSQRHEKRRVIILFLESVDSETAGRMKQLKNLLASSNVELFAISFVSRLGVPGGMPSTLNTTLLRELTQATAGQAFFSVDYRDHPEDIVRQLLSHLRTFYTFGFHSESESANPGKLTIKCSRPSTKIKQHPTVPTLE